MSSPQDSLIEARLDQFGQEFAPQLERLLPPSTPVAGPIIEAARYSALAPGKRVRPFLVVRFCEVCGESRDHAWPVAAAVECIHAFSLIHDDLPAMDDDDLRRGRPTCHRRFGEALAILAGDALAVLPFELIAQHIPEPAIAIALVRELAIGTGWQGMIGGQALDVLEEGKPPSLSVVSTIHERKTAALFATACRMGARLAFADSTRFEAAGAYGRHLGLAFQITDDLLDVLSMTDVLGKEAGKDAARGKQTYPRCVGVEASREAARHAGNRAVAALQPWGPEADDLRALAAYVVQRLR